MYITKPATPRAFGMGVKSKTKRLMMNSTPASQFTKGDIVNATFAPKVKNRIAATIIPTNTAIPSSVPPIDFSVFIKRQFLLSFLATCGDTQKARHKRQPCGYP